MLCIVVISLNFRVDTWWNSGRFGARYLTAVIILQRFSLIPTNTNDVFPSFMIHILLTWTFAFWLLHDTFYLIRYLHNILYVIDNNNDAIVYGKREESLQVWKKQKSGRKKNDGKDEKRERRRKEKSCDGEAAIDLISNKRPREARS